MLFLANGTAFAMAGLRAIAVEALRQYSEALSSSPNFS